MPIRFMFLGLALVASLTAIADQAQLTIGYLELDDDRRYRERALRAGLRALPRGRPYAGAQVALREGRFAAASVGVELRLAREKAKDPGALVTVLERLHEEGVRLFLLDLPAEAMRELAQHARGKELLLFNLSALDDELRGMHCQSRLLHVSPSYSMLMDALAQHLVTRKWRKVLALEGPRPEDARLLKAFSRAAKRFGLKIVDERDFVVGNNPREREQNNIALLTGGRDYDVVFVADASGEFARGVPYSIQKPRPVVGSAGLVPDWWHWAWERHGAPQLNGRFLKKAKRLMSGYDWSAWMAVKTISEALLRTRSREFGPLSAFILGNEIVLDGFKGHRLSYRPWNRQLRQPLFLTTGEWVIARAPLDGFLHATNNLDTLGFDDKDSECIFR